ncbi:MAG: heme biosynthesis protein HemY [Neomegalonema sp.]|nr:heme biosynthesis protein HemY [Neomegalonema sp.]
MWSLVLRISLAIAAVVGVGYAVSRFVTASGFKFITLPVFQTEIMITDQNLLMLLIVIALLALATVVTLRGARWFMAFAPHYAAKRRRRGVSALSQALVALAEGDGERARKAALKAEQILDEPDLTRIINAQAARLSGREKEAEKYYEAMSEDKETAFIGLVGLLGQALREKMPERALRLAERAHALKPKEPQVIDAMFDLQLRKGDWAAARKTLKAALRAGRLTKDVEQRRRAVLYVSEAQQAEMLGDDNAALDAARSALKSAPGLTPAAAMAAKLLQTRGDAHGASRIIIRAWRSSPHPALAEAFAALDPNETPKIRLARFQQLFDVHPEHRETRETKAELALAADDPEAARSALGDLPAEGVSARACALMAAVEEAQGGDEATIRVWLERAATAPRRAQWTCSACGSPSPTWRHSCGRCDAFDTMEWRMVEHISPAPAANGAATPAALAGPAPARSAGMVLEPGNAKALPNANGGALVTTSLL